MYKLIVSCLAASLPHNSRHSIHPGSLLKNKQKKKENKIMNHLSLGTPHLSRSNTIKPSIFCVSSQNNWFHIKRKKELRCGLISLLPTECLFHFFFLDGYFNTHFSFLPYYIINLLRIFSSHQ